MIELSIEGRHYSLPEDWTEVTQRDLMIISDLFTRFYSCDDFSKHALIRLLGIKKNLVPYGDQVAFAEGIYRILPFAFLIRKGIRNGKVKVFSKEDLLVLSQMLSWINSPDPEFKNTLTTNLLARISVRRNMLLRHHLYGPCDHLGNVTALEFAKADHAFLSYCSSGDVKHLDSLIGILYRPKKWYWRIEKLFSSAYNSPRMSYTDLLYRKVENISKRTSLQVKYAVFLFVQGCRNEFSAKYPFVFSTDGSENKSSTGWAGIFRTLTNESIVDIEKVMELPIHTVLFDLNEKIRIHKHKNPHTNG